MITNITLVEQRMEIVQKRYEKLQSIIADSDLPKRVNAYKKAMQEYALVEETIALYKVFLFKRGELEDTREMANAELDLEIKAMAQEEIDSLETDLEQIVQKLKVLLVPKDPLDGKDIIIEIRAGTGGDEASLFVADLYRMYGRYSESRKWKVEVLNSSETEAGGFKEIVFSVSGKGVYGNLRYESGAHRVQRVPNTESQGRIHTSAVTVAVLPEAEETDITIQDSDVKVDVYRSSGPGGQSVNKTDSAVRLTHLPSGLVVTCQDEKSQIKNKAKAFRVLRARLYELKESKKQTERATNRRNQIGSGDRSERIRTYNFPQNRITDHRVNLTLYKLEQVMQGDLNEILDGLKIGALENALVS
ncbi:Peptide chain release factor 1 [Olavius algarvensis spirochete endosymbiont]|uniref:peptide chain release factor 1 n=1 Tax=Olavius algarvensis spirochete endosymbiont TaxID=260710 RepID=UPI00052CAD94|nr:peptide chain release factor 1 [Olavius algarvensis spirochete endosymbiont]KGM42846.1 peptide chain release factor 1 [Alkalispirochaeta odontotermitis]VDA99062.1 Peptide chain release factor 1 [Olavius algarvensis spirochete endosymbiont]